MEQRLNIRKEGQEALKTLYGIGAYLKYSPIERKLRELVYVRVSQINACPYCLDMHCKEARANGETEQRIYGLSAWRDTPYFSERERAALSFAEAVTYCHVTDDIYDEAKLQFSGVELIDLTLAITRINTWNRINSTFQYKPGSYILGEFQLLDGKSA